ncbi:uncharacterized protein VTP21DRAFT_8486 [Calcarisporiella thermophila]|uniref:uncharacterized protein n=1 Tax=Calcarisporiella thermophila TaxID=911321 RepID=UPI003742FC5A
MPTTSTRHYSSARTYSDISSGGSVFETDNEIDRHLQFIAENSTLRGGKAAITARIALLQEQVQWHGVDEEQVYGILDIILSGKLDEPSAKKLTKLLLPRYQVSSDCAVRIIGAIKSGANLNVLAILLRWLILVYDYLDTRGYIQNLYGVLFHYLEYETLRPNLCHLLYFLTKREHVKPFRIRKLLDLQNRVGQEPHLVGLLSVYKDYAPNLVMTAIPPVRSVIFKCPDINWQQNIIKVQARWNSSLPTDKTFSRQPIEKRSVTKRRKLDRVELPPIRTTTYSMKSVGIEEISSFKDLVKNIDKLELPNQLAAVLDNRLLQHLVICNPERSTVARISNWLGQCLMDICFWNDSTVANRKRLNDLLEKVIQLTDFTKELLPIFEAFLSSYISSWNGLDYQDKIFRLLAHLRPMSSEDMHNRFLDPLCKLFCVSAVDWKAKLILCYANILQRWTRRELQVSADPNDSYISEQTSVGLFNRLSQNVDLNEAVRGLIRHVHKMCVFALEIEHDDIRMQHSVLTFYEHLSTTVERDFPMLELPTASIISRCFFSTSGMAVSRICGILERYKTMFEQSENSKHQDIFIKRVRASYLPQDVTRFNGYITDICNALWMSVAFKTPEAFQMTEGLIRELRRMCENRGENMSQIFSLTYSPAFISLSQRFVRHLEDMHTLPIPEEERCHAPMSEETAQSSSLPIKYTEYRETYLDHLDDIGFTGLRRFLYCTMDKLIKKERQRLREMALAGED